MDHILTSTQLQSRGAKRQLSYYRIWNQFFILKVPEVGVCICKLDKTKQDKTRQDKIRSLSRPNAIHGKFLGKRAAIVWHHYEELYHEEL